MAAQLPVAISSIDEGWFKMSFYLIICKTQIKITKLSFKNNVNKE